MEPITRRSALRVLGASAGGVAVASASGLLLPAQADSGSGADSVGSRVRHRFPGDPGRGNVRYGAAVEGGDPRVFERRLGHRLQTFRQFFQASDSAAAIVAGV